MKETADFDIVVIGAGLSGLLIGRQLQQAGLNVVMLEGRDRIGGRIHSVDTANGTRVEMGATWFGPQHIHLRKLLDTLQIESFEQYMQGITHYQPDPNQPIQQIQLPPQPPSYRIAGGTKALIDKLAEGLLHVHIGEKVKAVDFSEQLVSIHTDSETYQAQKVISTLPPALLVSNIQITPRLPTYVVSIAQQTHTWMHDSIKESLVYEKPFWKERGFSGALFSNVGPAVEFYDQSNSYNDRYALCGFLNNGLAHLSREQRKELLLAQLEQAYGREAKEYIEYLETNWREEIFSSDGYQDLVPHQANGHPIYKQALYDQRFWIGGTETSTVYGGYMEGAVYRAHEIVKEVLATSKRSVQ